MSDDKWIIRQWTNNERAQFATWNGQQPPLLIIAPDGATWTFYHAGEVAGTLRFAEGRWTFVGEADASARALFDALETMRR